MRPCAWSSTVSCTRSNPPFTLMYQLERGVIGRPNASRWRAPCVTDCASVDGELKSASSVEKIVDRDGVVQAPARLVVEDARASPRRRRAVEYPRQLNPATFAHGDGHGRPRRRVKIHAEGLLEVCGLPSSSDRSSASLRAASAGRRESRCARWPRPVGAPRLHVPPTRGTSRRRCAPCAEGRTASSRPLVQACRCVTHFAKERSRMRWTMEPRSRALIATLCHREVGMSPESGAAAEEKAERAGRPGLDAGG